MPFLRCLVIFSLVLSTLVGCRTERERDYQMKQLRHGEWQRADTLSFEVFVDQGHVAYGFSLLLRINNRFDRLSLPLEYDVKNRFGYCQSGGFEVKIAEYPGDFRNFIGAYRQYELPIGDFTFPVAGIYTFRFYYSLNLPRLRGVENVGLLVEKSRV